MYLSAYIYIYIDRMKIRSIQKLINISHMSDVDMYVNLLFRTGLESFHPDGIGNGPLAIGGAWRLEPLRKYPD